MNAIENVQIHSKFYWLAGQRLHLAAETFTYYKAPSIEGLSLKVRIYRREQKTCWVSLGNFLTLYTSTDKEEKVLRHLNFLVFFCLYMTYLQLSRCRRPSILSFPFIYLFIFKLLLINVMKSSKLKELEEGVINVRRSTEDTSKENTTECSSERKPVSLAFFNVSSKNKCI